MAPDLLSTIRDEIEERLNELRPRLAEYEQLLVASGALLAGGAAEAAALAAAGIVPGAPASAAPQTPKRGRGRPRKNPVEAPSATRAKPARAARGAAREAILGALEHGSHTVGELAVVTAMSTANINGNVRRLAAEGKVVRTEREGKTAYALANG